MQGVGCRPLVIKHFELVRVQYFHYFNVPQSGQFSLKTALQLQIECQLHISALWQVAGTPVTG